MKPITSPLKAIRANCIACVGSYAEVERCTAEATCILFPYRFGKNPFRKKRVYTDEQMEAMTARMQKARDGKAEESRQDE